MSLWDVAPGGCKPGVKQLSLKGTSEARCKPPRRWAGLRGRMVRKRSDKRPSGKPSPCHEIPCIPWDRIQVIGAVIGSKRRRSREDHRVWPAAVSDTKVSAGQLAYPADDQEPQGVVRSDRSRHLNGLAESTYVNVGGFQGNEKMRSPSRSPGSVGGVIVLGARESLVHGEGRQRIEHTGQNTRVLTRVKSL